MTTPPDPVAAARRRLDRMILIWPAMAIVVAGISWWDDRRVGRPPSWADLIGGGALIVCGAVIYVACRWRLRAVRRLIEAIRSS